MYNFHILDITADQFEQYVKENKEKHIEDIIEGVSNKLYYSPQINNTSILNKFKKVEPTIEQFYNNSCLLRLYSTIPFVGEYNHRYKFIISSDNEVFALIETRIIGALCRCLEVVYVLVKVDKPKSIYIITSHELYKSGDITIFNKDLFDSIKNSNEIIFTKLNSYALIKLLNKNKDNLQLMDIEINDNIDMYSLKESELYSKIWMRLLPYKDSGCSFYLTSNNVLISAYHNDYKLINTFNDFLTIL